MKNKKPFQSVLFFITLVLTVPAIISCNNPKSIELSANPDEYYTCSMDPQVMENKPGNCPICHMKLIKVKKNNLKEGQIKLSEQQIKLANITYDTLRENELSKEFTLTGKVTIDQNLTEAISSKIQGRVVKLYLKNIGDHINKGQILYEIYSEDLNIAQQEYIAAIQSTPLLRGLVEGARNKLLLYGMTESQINNLKITKHVLNHVPYFANADGFVSEIFIVEGNYISTGSVLFELSSFNSLWVEAQVYLPYLPFVKNETEATFLIPSSGEKIFNGKIIFIDPQVQTPERFVLARFLIENPAPQIKPGMLVNISIQASKTKALTLPIDAIIQNSVGVNVWVRNKDGVFENKMVVTGVQNSSQVEIKSGLSKGDIVVITGAYLLNSEYVFKKGASPMAGHGHKALQETTTQSMPGMNM